MKTKTIEQSVIINATPHQVFETKVDETSDKIHRALHITHQNQPAMIGIILRIMRVSLIEQ